MKASGRGKRRGGGLTNLAHRITKTGWKRAFFTKRERGEMGEREGGPAYKFVKRMRKAYMGLVEQGTSGKYYFGDLKSRGLR